MEITKMTLVKDVLRSVRKYDFAAENAYQGYASLRSEIFRLTPIYDGIHVKTGTNGTDLAGGIARLEDAGKNVLRCYDRYIDQKAHIEELIARMGDHPDEMKCLRLRYLSYRENKNWRLLNWDVIADRMHVSRRNATTIHGKALRIFEALLKENQ